ncbi:MAG: Gfo/Idh/MocA family oxidoreductase [Candidatus Pacebacteria bacterium]|nr:Gfo/Idh/MocA family oxidoreductase [Candidatus Paceibacterota bacterium]
MKVLIIGAGSIGNHLAQASRRMGWQVTVSDTDLEALRRMREDIYPTRYGVWDGTIRLIDATGCRPEIGEFDIIMIGTPPDSHTALATKALALKPAMLHVEKPLLAAPDDVRAFEEAVRLTPGSIVTVGYDHAVAPSVAKALEYVRSGLIGDVLSMDVVIHASFADIFAAHPWLASINDSYLSDWRRGGGALQEHSHGLHLAHLFAEAAGYTSLTVRSSALDFEVDDEGADYDRLAHVTLQGGDMFFVHVVEDVFTRPTRKEVHVRGSAGSIAVELTANSDVVMHRDVWGVLEKGEVFPKTRPDDFYALVQHYDDLLAGRVQIADSPVRVETGIEVMRYIQEAFKKYS